MRDNRMMSLLLAAAFLLTGCLGSFAEGQKAPDFILEGFEVPIIGTTSRHICQLRIIWPSVKDSYLDFKLQITFSPNKS